MGEHDAWLEGSYFFHANRRENVRSSETSGNNWKDQRKKLRSPAPLNSPDFLCNEAGHYLFIKSDLGGRKVD